MEFFRFILSGFWTWAGFLILIVAAGNAVAEIIKAARPARKIETYRIGERWRVEIDGATAGDVAAVLNNAGAEGGEAPSDTGVGA